MSWAKTNIDGRDAYESSEGERRNEPDKEHGDLYGYTQVIVDGVVMYESPDGTERVTN